MLQLTMTMSTSSPIDIVSTWRILLSSIWLLITSTLALPFEWPWEFLWWRSSALAWTLFALHLKVRWLAMLALFVRWIFKRCLSYSLKCELFRLQWICLLTWRLSIWTFGSACTGILSLWTFICWWSPCSAAILGKTFFYKLAQLLILSILCENKWSSPSLLMESAKWRVVFKTSQLASNELLFLASNVFGVVYTSLTSSFRLSSWLWWTNNSTRISLA